MNLQDRATCARTTDAANAIDQAHQLRDDLGHLDRTRLTEAVGHLTEIARCVAMTLDYCASGADNRSTWTEEPAIAEVHRDTHRAAATARGAARSLRRALLSAHTLAENAHTTQAPAAGDRPSLTGQGVRDLLETAAGGLCFNVHPVTDPAALATVVADLVRITDRLVGLIDRCGTAAGRLADRAPTAAGVTAHRHTEHALTKAVALARVLRRRLDPVRTCADRGHELTRRNQRNTT
jgi:hypothetical protein